MKYIFTTLIIFFSFLNFYSQCPTGRVSIKIVLTTDNYASETTWQLKDKFCVVLLSNGTLTNAFVTSKLLFITNEKHLIL